MARMLRQRREVQQVHNTRISQASSQDVVGAAERIFKHLESMNLLTHDSVVIDFMSGTGRTGTMAALRRYRTISVELEPHFIEMIAGYDCDGKSISDFRIEPCVCK